MNCGIKAKSTMDMQFFFNLTVVTVVLVVIVTATNYRLVDLISWQKIACVLNLTVMFSRGN